MIPWLIFAVIVVPLAVIAYFAIRRPTAASEHPPTETDADRARTEAEFAEAEAYQEQWREEHHDDLEHKRMP